MNVFRELGEAFRQAVENFRKELHRDRIPESVDGLLQAMRREIVDARAELRDLEDEVRRTLERAATEEEEAATCRRREALALEIGDEETATVAREFETRHRKRKAILERKALALKEELDLRRSDLEDMHRRLERAKRDRDTLAAKAGGTGARDTLRDASDLFTELDRMAERIREDEHRARAAADLEEELANEPRPRWTEDELRERVEELQRRMEEGPGAA